MDRVAWKLVRKWIAGTFGPHCAYGHLAAESVGYCLEEYERDRRIEAGYGGDGAIAA